MSRHGKSKGKSQSGKPRHAKINEQPHKNVVAAEATGAPNREDIVRQEPAPPPMRAETHAAPEPGALRQPPAMENAVDTLQRSFQAAQLGTVEVNRMLIDISRGNVASGLDFAKSLAAARTPIEAARLQLAFFDERMKALLHQAEALRALSADLVARANEPIREHMRVKGLASWWR